MHSYNIFVFGFIVLLLTFFAFNVFSQNPVDDDIAKIVYMDSIVIKASREDFSAPDFIEMIREDESFYLAFRNLRAADYSFLTDMSFFNRKGVKDGAYVALHHQVIEDGCRYQMKITENLSGKFYNKRRKKSKFYTFELYDRLFLLHDTTCNITVQPQRVDFEGEGMEGHVSELKKLIFAPGTGSNVPFIGDKTEVFSEKMQSRYDYMITSARYGPDSIDSYVFRVKIKPEFAAEKNNKTVIKDLTTYFSKKDFQVLGRRYRLAHYKALYQFNVFMDIQLLKVNGIYLPSRIHYDGFWDIPFKRKETSNFTVTFKNYQ